MIKASTITAATHGTHFVFCLLRDVEETFDNEDVDNDKDGVICFLREQNLLPDADEMNEDFSPPVLSPELDLVVTGKMVLLGILGAYQPHQYTLGF